MPPRSGRAARLAAKQVSVRNGVHLRRQDRLRPKRRVLNECVGLAVCARRPVVVPHFGEQVTDCRGPDLDHAQTFHSE